VGQGDRALIVDDVLATGHGGAAAKLVRGARTQVVGFTFLIELDFLRDGSGSGTSRVEALLHTRNLATSKA